jgi:Tol biopolymer transport system component
MSDPVRVLCHILLFAAVPPVAMSGQEPHGSVAPSVFAEGIVSTGHEFTVTFAHDGRTVYFTRSDQQTRRNHLMQSVQGPGGWQAATQLPFSSSAWSDLDPALSPDGRHLYFISTRPKPNALADTTTDMDVWVADRQGASWAEPRWLESLSSKGKEGSPTVDRAGNICFFSDRDAVANQNAIYCAKPGKGGFGPPVKLGPSVNVGPSDTSPFLAPDGNTLLFYSTRAGGQGAADLYLSRKRGGQWQPAVSLGPVVNSTEFEYNPSTSPDGTTLYFGRKGRVWEVPMKALDSRVIAARMFK